MIDTLVREIALALGKHKYIVVHADKYEWDNIVCELLNKGKVTRDYWISNNGNARISRYSGLSSLRGASFKGGRPTLFLANKYNGLDNNELNNIVYMLAKNGEFKYV